MSIVLKVNTILVCKNSMLREGLKHILSDTRFNLLLDNSTNGNGGTATPPDVSPDLIILDAGIDPFGVADIVRSLKEQHSGARIVVLANQFDRDSMLASLQAGADGYCLSTVGCDVLIRYLDLVMFGEVVFPSAFVLASLSPSAGNAEASRPVAVEARGPLQTISTADARSAPVRTLSSREAEILQCLVQGAPNKVIARKLDVAEATVKVHIKAILRKIRVANRTQAAMWAVSHLPVSYADHTLPQAGEGLPLHYSPS